MTRSRLQWGSHIIGTAAIAAVLCVSGIILGCASARGRPSEADAEFWGFTAPWDARSEASAAAHAAQLDVIVSGFITLDSASLQPIVLFPDPLAKSNPGNRRRMALLTSYHGTRFHPETIRALASDSIVLARTAGRAAALLGADGYRGLVLDFEGHTADDLDVLIRVSRAFADSARAHGVSPTGMAIPATDTVDYPGRPLLGAVDFLVVMLYDQHWLTSPPGPISSPDWAMRALGIRASDIGSSRVVAAFPTYGYQWRADSATAVISYAEAEHLARDGHVALLRDPASSNLHAASDGWTLWATDAVLLDSLVRSARRTGVTRFALWRLGLEDPKNWTEVVR
jgi:spore germination protein YaaH